MGGIRNDVEYITVQMEVRKLLDLPSSEGLGQAIWRDPAPVDNEGWLDIQAANKNKKITHE